MGGHDVSSPRPAPGTVPIVSSPMVNRLRSRYRQLPSERFSRQLDSIAQRLTAIEHRLTELETTVTRADVDTTAAAVESVRDSVTQLGIEVNDRLAGLSDQVVEANRRGRSSSGG